MAQNKTETILSFLENPFLGNIDAIFSTPTATSYNLNTPRVRCWIRIVVVFSLVQLTCRTLLSRFKNHRPKLYLYGGCYVISLVVSALILLRGALLFYAVMDMPPTVQYGGIGALDEVETNQIFHHMVLTNDVFVGYLLFDMTHLVMYFGDYGKMDMVMHHLGFIFCSLVCQYYMVFILPFTWLIMGELSTIFLNLRWLLRQWSWDGTKLLRSVEVLFALSFFAVRVVLYGFGLGHLVKCVYLDGVVGVPTAMSPFLHSLIVAILTGLFLLNLLWFRSILKMGKKGRTKMRGQRDSRKDQ